MLDQCIFEVYKRDKKVFIPDFGAIIYSEFNDGVNFNSLLDFDDGKVIAEIQKQQFLSEEDARKELKAYVQDIKKTLDKGKPAFFGGIGYLSVDSSGNISIEKAKSPHSSRKTRKNKKSEPHTETVEPEAESGEKESVIDDVEVNNTFEAKAEPDVESSEQAPTDGYKENTFQEEELQESEWKGTREDDLADEEAIPLYDERLEWEEDRQKRKNRVKAAVLVAAPLLLLIAGGYYYFNYHSSSADQDYLYSEKTQLSVPSREVAETIDEKVADMAEEANPEEIQEPAPAASGSEIKAPSTEQVKVSNEPPGGDGETYSLIFGSFKVESNADNYRQHLESQGIQVSKFTGKSDFYFVGYEKIEGKTQAVKLLRDAKEENPSAWIINKELLRP